MNKLKEIEKFLEEKTNFHPTAFYKIEPLTLLSLYREWLSENYNIVKKEKNEAKG